jgi:hypothetical protein
MSFQNDLLTVAGLQDAYRPGLQALRGNDHNHVTAKNPNQISGSADIDTALVSQYPSRNRWDYVIARRTGRVTEKLYWIEIHPAHSTAEAKVVVQKANWLKQWLAGPGNALASYERELIWVPTAAVAFHSSSPQAKTLVQAGVIPPKGKVFTIP